MSAHGPFNEWVREVEADEPSNGCLSVVIAFLLLIVALVVRALWW